MKIVILANEQRETVSGWEVACSKRTSIDYRIVDLTGHLWLEQINSFKPDLLLARPSAISSTFKQVYDERVYILNTQLGYQVFPSPIETFIYENKRFLSFWLKANEIPHPKTYVFYHYKDALNFIQTKDKLVAKTNIGASGRGVKILHSLDGKKEYVNKAFKGEGITSSSGPNLKKKAYVSRIINLIANPGLIKQKIKVYKSVQNQVQSGFVIFQEFIPHEFEWRVVRIGDSFFAHKKMKMNEKASGSLIKEYDNVPFELLDFVKDITDKHQFYSQAVDIFEFDGKYLVNEMQCIFGQSDTYQMLVDGKPGRYIQINGKWIFEEGDFAKNACYDLRLNYIINQINSNK